MSRSSNEPSVAPSAAVDMGLLGLVAIAGHYRIAADPVQLQHDLNLQGRFAEPADLMRCALRLKLKVRLMEHPTFQRILSSPMPLLARLQDDSYRVVLGLQGEDAARVADLRTRTSTTYTLADWVEMPVVTCLLVTRRWGGPGINPVAFGFQWFLPSILRYRTPLTHVVLSSLIIQLFALATPLLFQVIIDKVLVQQGVSTLSVIAIGLAGIALFDVVIQYLRTYALGHTTNRIDVELGSRLFDHLLRLPMAYFNSRPTGQTVARMREIETIRTFLTGQALSSLLDLLFAVIFIAILFLYSVPLAIVALLSLPLYILIAEAVRPGLRAKINERFNTGAASQQFLVESVFGMETLKAAAVEPMLRNEWEDRLAAYVRASFQSLVLSSAGQGGINFVSKITTVAVLFFGAKAVMANQMSIGGLIAFNMILAQLTAPILRLSQLWQDFQQVRVSVERIGDILNTPPEAQRLALANLPPAKGQITIDSLSFRYHAQSVDVLKNISLQFQAGQTVGIYGGSGSGKSTLTKLIQLLYRPERGRILIDGVDTTHVDTTWLRRQIGVVLQENVLFNKSVHDNISLINPALLRATVMAAAKLAGADEFISRLPYGYDTIIEERGSNLSGGQRQRIALARALVSNPKILILDEATSALDLESEQIIRRNMRQIADGRTVLIIAHRLATLRNCDMLYGLQDGLVVEHGTHAALLAQTTSLYSRLWNIQMEADDV